MNLRNNYFFSSFFWSTLQKVLTALVNFISVPLLLGYYGKADYGLLSIATACNGYMHLLDLGMNVGAVKFFSQWKTEGNMLLVNRVARTNITFYAIIAAINILLLLALAIWGEGLFAVTHSQFLQLRACLIIIASFSLFSWGATTFNQLLIADMQMAFTMQMQSIVVILKVIVIGLVFWVGLTLTQYFFLYTATVALLIIPYSIKCKRSKLIDSVKPAFYWKDFKLVILFSLSIFALSLFQVTAKETRPLLLGIFANNGAEAVADLHIIQVFPSLIIMICGTFASIFLPKASTLVTEGDQDAISRFAYKWTIFTSVLANCMCFPFIVCSDDIITAYVGLGYENLSIWLIIWVLSVLLQVHSTPAHSLILAYGKTKLMVYVAAIACVISMIINAILAKQFDVGSAVIGYFVYIIINLCSYYGFYYKKILHIENLKIIMSFLRPTLCGLTAAILVMLFFNGLSIELTNLRVSGLLVFGVKSIIWFVLFSCILIITRVVMIKNKRIVTKFDS